MTQYETIEVTQKGGVVTLMLARPSKYNALNHTTAREIMAVCKQVARDDSARCLLISGQGKGFCAGQDLTDSVTRDETFSFYDHLTGGYNRMVLALRRLEKPVIMAINGACAGAGLGLALAGDIRYASDRAKFLTAFIGIGLVPDTGVAYWLPRLVGPAVAAELLFTNDVISAETAAQIGLINKVVPADSLMQEAAALATKLAAGPTLGIGLTKRILNRSLGITFDELLDYEAQIQEIAGRSHDYKEGVMAFREKRKPNFTGK